MDKLTHAGTLKLDYFKKHLDFKDIIKDHKDKDPFGDDDLVGKCFDHALSTGEGFEEWVYTTYAYIRASLSPHIQDQTSGVKLGDIALVTSALLFALLSLY